jgi:hypothetical protein
MTPNSKTVVLEVLRDGPSYNQLLSPLTVYLAACQNRPPESLRLSVEHRDFLRWQGGLTYAAAGDDPTAASRASLRRTEASREVRANAIDDATRAVTAILGSIRALIAELASEPCDWRHIHLVLDAAELGALPFELAQAAPGLMVEGERLFLQQNARVTLTRQTRRVATSVVSWPSRPRILFIVGEGDLPVEAHLLALRQGIDPWIGWNDGDSVEWRAWAEADKHRTELLAGRRREAEQMLTVLLNPTLDDVSRETRRTSYTHVHILSHGAPLRDVGPGQSLYGLAFRAAGGGIDVVDGDRLEAALRSGRECEHPTVVTLAACEGGNVSGAILGPGASVAHALHSKGVPLAVAAQFPLSKGASAIFAEMMYMGILRGEDPRQVVHAIRRELLVTYPHTHDWASLVVYGSFPLDLDGQLLAVRRSAERLALETAAERLRVTYRRWDFNHNSTIARDRSRSDGEVKAELDNVNARLRADIERLDRVAQPIAAWLDESNDIRTRVNGLRLWARIALRMWDLLSLPSSTSRGAQQPRRESFAGLLGRRTKHDDSTGSRPLSMLAPVELLRFAQDCYTRAYALDGSLLELWVQVAFLRWMISTSEPQATASGDEEDIAYFRQLTAIQAMAENQLQLGERHGAVDRDSRSLRTAIVFEVSLLIDINKWQKFRSGGSKALHQVRSTRDWFEDFVAAAQPISTSYRAHMMWRQLRRYEALGPGLEFAQPFRERLERLEVRKYWGPRP